ncbi:MAG: CDP-alcohol phosphatidyltransferase family protein [Mariprofundaceae bacterium]
MPHLIIPLAQQDVRPALLSIGGLPLLKRNILTARRAGFSVITLVLLNDTSLPDDLVCGAEVRSISAADMIEDTIPDRVLILSPKILFRPRFFRRVEKMQNGKTHVFGVQAIAVLGKFKYTALLATAAQQTKNGAQALVHLAQALDKSAKADVDDCMTVDDADAVQQAEKRLFGDLSKETDGFLANLINRRISLAVTRCLMNTSVSPNQMTLVSTAIGLAAALCFLSPVYGLQLTGALLFLLHSILDGCDGELARLKFMDSRLGGILDFWSDNLVHMAVFTCMGIGWGLTSGETWPFALAAGATGGTFLSAALVYTHSMREQKENGPLYTSVSTSTKKTKPTQLADTLSRRDFIYLVLLLALFGKAQWFVLPAAIGAPLFAVLLVTIARSDKHRV